MFQLRAPRIVSLAAVALLLAVSRATAGCGGVVYCDNVMDYYVTDNLLRMVADAEQARIDAFFRKLGCWTEDGENSAAKIVCKNGREEVAYAFQRDDEYASDPVLLFIANEQPEQITSNFAEQTKRCGTTSHQLACGI